MKPPVKILPLAAIAVGGVLAFKALDAAGGLPNLFNTPSARAEEAGRGKPKVAATSGPSTAPAAAAPRAKPPAPICAPGAADLAREAGLSPAELSVIQSLSSRRGQLDAREQSLDVQIQLLAAAEAKVDGKLRALDAAKAQIQALLGQADAQSQAEVDRLVTVYEKMKPRDAGAVMAQLDDRVRVPVAAKMKPAILAAVLPNMGTLEAKRLTENLARRFAGVRDAVQAATALPPAPGAKPAAAPTPTQTAAAAAPPADPTAKPAEPKPKPRPQRVARATPPKPKAKPAAPKAEAAETKPEAKADAPPAKLAEPAKPEAKPAS